MTPSKRFMNWSNVTFTPTGGTPEVITGVTSCTVNDGGSLAKFSADADRFHTTIVNDFNDPSVTVQCADLAAVKAFPVGTVGVLTMVYDDAKNRSASAGGALLITLDQAIVANNPIQGAHRQFGSGTLTFMGQSTDGVTNPLTVVPKP